jgi:hypothetical protein
MDDLSSHFYVTVGQLLDQAAVGRLRVRVELADGGVADGVPMAEGRTPDDELDDTGYPSHVQIDGKVVSLRSVVTAVVFHPREAVADQ